MKKIRKLTGSLLVGCDVLYSEDETEAITKQVGEKMTQCDQLIGWLQYSVEFFGDPIRRLLCLALSDLPPLSPGDGSSSVDETGGTDKLIVQILLMDHLMPDPLQEQAQSAFHL